jgi:antitoxin YefM
MRITAFSETSPKFLSDTEMTRSPPSAKQPLVGIALSSCTHFCTFFASSEDYDMQTINYTTARAHLAETMDRVNEDRAPLLVTRQKGEPVVMMSLAEYNALEETAYLLRSPANAERLIKSIGEMRAGKAKVRQLIEE